MNTEYWVSNWAIRRQDEVVRIPAEHTIHADFLQQMNTLELKSALTETNTLFQTIYGDIALHPDEYGMPLYLKDKFRVFSSEFTESGQAPYRPFILLHHLLVSSEINNTCIIVDVEKYKGYKPPPRHETSVNQIIKKTHLLFSKLMDYGFIFEGLKNKKLTSANIQIAYPDNPNVLLLLKHLADKTYQTNRIQDFLSCHFRLLQDDMETANYDNGADVVTDRVTDAEKQVVYALDKILTEKGFVTKYYGGIECHGIAYYHNEKDMNTKKPYTYRLITRDMDFDNPDINTERMLLQLRIRKVANCLSYLAYCSDSVRNIFAGHSDDGCPKRFNQTCKHGIKYEIDGKQYWRCACCHTPFNIKPQLSDVPDYVKLVELGEK